MGTWGTGLFSNDITCDVKDAYVQFLKEQFSNEEAYKKTLKEFECLFETEEEPLFWYALADTQWNLGRLMPEVKEVALNFLNQRGGSSLWDDDPKCVMKWERTLQKLKGKIEAPMPPEKKIKKPVLFATNPWNVGDVYAYQFHTEKAAKHGLSGKYILFQKLGESEYFKDTVYSIVQVFDRVFDVIPELDVLEGVRMLPLATPPGIYPAPDNITDYVPSFECYLKANMHYVKKSDYPQKYFTFVGNKTVPETDYAGNRFTSFFWEKEGFDDWLVEYYVNWQNVEY